MNPRPPTHVVTYQRGRSSGEFRTYSEQDAADYAARWEAANFQVTVKQINYPPIPDGLRPLEQTETAA
jgi:hypothetical protein